MYEEALDEARKRRQLRGDDMTQVDPRIETIRAAYRSSGPKAYWQKVMEFEVEAARDQVDGGVAAPECFSMMSHAPQAVRAFTTAVLAVSFRLVP